jgi:endonuclease/exonuclease/phosphatase family metal-dependent hydrolase
MKRIVPLVLVLLLQGIAPAQTSKVMTYNILADWLEGPEERWLDPDHPRRDRVGSILQQEDADLIGFQEVTDSQLPDLIDFLPEYDYLLGTSAGFFNAIFYKRDRYSILENDFINLPNSSNDQGGFRDVLWAQMFDWNTNQSFVMADTHLASGSPDSGLARVFQANLIQQEMPAITNGLPLVFVGDFNVNPFDEGYSIVTGQTGPQNFTLDNACDPFCGGAPTYPNGSQIDHVLHSSEFVATDARVVTDLIAGLYPSDHFAVTAELLNSSPPTTRPDQVRHALFSEGELVWERRTPTGFDGLGDGVGPIPFEHFNEVGMIQSGTTLSRQMMKFELPSTMVTEITFESATLRIFVLNLLGTLPEGLSLMHGIDDNDSEVLTSHYEAPYVDTGLDLFVPPDGDRQYYDIDVTEFVRADFESDGSDPWSAFRLEFTDGEQFTGSNAYRINSFLLEITVNVVPEPATGILLLFGMMAILFRRDLAVS